MNISVVSVSTQVHSTGADWCFVLRTVARWMPVSA